MTAYQANRSTTQTLTGTDADQVTLTQRWGAVRITNLHASNWLWVTPNDTVAVAAAEGAIPVPPNSSRVIDVAHVTSARTMILGIVGNGNQYTIEGMFGSQAEVLAALADEVAEGLQTSSAFRGAKVFAGAGTSLANATLVPVAFNSEAYDTDGFHDTVTNNDRITIPAGLAGTYLVSAGVVLASSAVAHYAMSGYLRKNGVSATRIIRSSGPAGANPTIDLPGATVSLAAGDYVQFGVVQESGSAIDTLPGEDLSWLSVTYLGA